MGTQAAVDLLHLGENWNYQSDRQKNVSICISLITSVTETFVFHLL